MTPKLEHELFRLNPHINILAFNLVVSDVRERFAASGIDITHLTDVEVIELNAAMAEAATQTQM